MTLNLAGKTAFVTGGNIGIGRAVSLALARRGAEVALTYYAHGSQGEETAAAIRQMGRKAIAMQLDATDSDQVNDVAARAARTLGGHIDILMNNAGHLVGRSSIADMTDQHWFETINVNLTSAFFCTRAVLPYMNTGWGRIINMSSLAAHNGGGTGATAYAAAKAAVVAFTRGLCKEVADRGITVNAVAPGLILETPFHATFTSEAVVERVVGNTPVQRGGIPEDVAHAVLFFAAEDSSFITGETMEINGGAYFA